MILADPARRRQLAKAVRGFRDDLKLEQWRRRRWRDGEPLRAALAQRPVSVVPRVIEAIWFHYQAFAPSFRPDDQPPPQDVRQARKAYDQARRGKLDAALRTLDALITQLSDETPPGDDPGAARRAQLLIDASLFAGAVGYLICDETAGAYYATACGLAPRHRGALLVLGAIFLRLDRTAEARTMWGRALQVERDGVASEERIIGPTASLGQQEALEDARIRLKALEDMMTSLDRRPTPVAAT